MVYQQCTDVGWCRSVHRCTGRAGRLSWRLSSLSIARRRRWIRRCTLRHHPIASYMEYTVGTPSCTCTPSHTTPYSNDRHRTSDSHLKVLLLGALGAAPPTLLPRALAFMFSNEVRSQDAIYVLRGIKGRGLSLAWEFIKEQWPALLERYAGACCGDMVWACNVRT